MQLSRKEGEVGTASEYAISSLSGVVASSTRPWSQHVGALTGLCYLGFRALDKAVIPIASFYYSRLSQVLASGIPSSTSVKDTVDAHMTAGLLLVIILFLRGDSRIQIFFLNLKSKF